MLDLINEYFIAES